jgi:alanine racemase
MPHTYRTWVEISKSALQKNVRELDRILTKKAEFFAVVKGNAYGHGMEEIASVISPMKEVDRLLVFTVEEGIALRKSGVKKPIVVLKNCAPYEIPAIQKYSLEVAVSSLPSLRAIAKKATKKITVHICVDTGLGRDGFALSESEKVIGLVHGNKKILVSGLFTHFSGAESRSFDAYTVTQLSLLHEWRRRFADVGMHPQIHASATSGAFLGTDFHADAVRFGIGLYGLWPSEETQALNRSGVSLAPVLSWKARISEIKTVPAGTCVAYDCTFKTTKETTLAVVPIGYFDGYSRALSGKSAVLVKGVRVPVVGRVMMNMIVVDVSAVPKVQEGDVVTLIGKDGKDSIDITVEELASYRNTINYEIVTRINPTIPRLVVK